MLLLSYKCAQINKKLQQESSQVLEWLIDMSEITQEERDGLLYVIH